MHLLFTRLPNLNAYNWRRSSEGSNRIPLALWAVVHNTLSSLYMKEWEGMERMASSVIYCTFTLLSPCSKLGILLVISLMVQSSTAHFYNHVQSLVARLKLEFT